MPRELPLKFALLITRAFAFIGLLAFSLSQEFANANEFLQLSVSIGNEDNVPRSINSPSAAESGVVTTSFTGGKYFQLGAIHSRVLAAQLEADRYLEHRGFDQPGASLSAAYTCKFGFGAYAPKLGLAVVHDKAGLSGEARDRRFTTTELASKRGYLLDGYCRQARITM